jgi:hypothetical protein
METEQKQLEPVDANAPTGILPPTGGQTGQLSQLPPAQTPQAQWERVASQTTHFLEKLPEYLSNFFANNQRSLITAALILAAIITFKVVIAVLAAINGIPLLQPFFELIGIGYFAWFSWRYLFKTETRQELSEKFSSWKQEIVGK